MVMVSRPALPRRVLVVEHIASDRELIETAFRESRVEADLLVTSSAQEAFGYLLEEASRGTRGRLPFVVFLDLRLPAGSGVDFLVQMHQDPMLATLPVVAISGSTGEVEDLTAQGLHVKGYLPKPLSPRNVRQFFGSLDLVLWV